MLKINIKLIEDNKEYSINLTEQDTGKVIPKAIVLSGKDIKEILSYLYWSTSDAPKTKVTSNNKEALDWLPGGMQNKPKKTKDNPAGFEVIKPENKPYTF